MISPPIEPPLKRSSPALDLRGGTMPRFPSPSVGTRGTAPSVGQRQRTWRVVAPVDLRVGAVVPVKRLSSSKSRLGGVLSDARRIELQCAMLEDVLAALATCPLEVFVVTDDTRVREIAQLRGAEALDEPEAEPDTVTRSGTTDPEAGLNAALTTAADALARAGFDVMLVLPADVPLVEPPEIERLISAVESAPRAVAIAADRAGAGTNGLAQRPPGVAPFCFGADSAERHTRGAARAGAAVTRLRLETLSLDVDDPGDLELVRRHGGQGRTLSLLATLPGQRHTPLRSTG